jgi:hypothetical protein
MRLFTNIILGIIKLALAIGLAGGLTDMTLAMRGEAVKAHKTGLVHLKELNQLLVSDK